MSGPENAGNNELDEIYEEMMMQEEMEAEDQEDEEFRR